jgi:hypothetical protein
VPRPLDLFKPLFLVFVGKSLPAFFMLALGDVVGGTVSWHGVE